MQFVAENIVVTEMLATDIYYHDHNCKKVLVNWKKINNDIIQIAYFVQDNPVGIGPFAFRCYMM